MFGVDLSSELNKYECKSKMITFVVFTIVLCVSCVKLYFQMYRYSMMTVLIRIGWFMYRYCTDSDRIFPDLVKHGYFKMSMITHHKTQQPNSCTVCTLSLMSSPCCRARTVCSRLNMVCGAVGDSVTSRPDTVITASTHANSWTCTLTCHTTTLVS